MPKKPKKDKWNDPETRELISRMLKKEKTRNQIARRLGFSMKVVQYIIEEAKDINNLT